MIETSKEGGIYMAMMLFMGIINTLIFLGLMIGLIYLFVLIIKSLRKYLKSSDIRNEKNCIKKSLGERIKEHRTRCNMTQEFVAESIGVTRQAVSKWETGASDPSTSNLLALAKLFNISAENLLKDIS